MYYCEYCQQPYDPDTWPDFRRDREATCEACYQPIPEHLKDWFARMRQAKREFEGFPLVGREALAVGDIAYCSAYGVNGHIIRVTKITHKGTRVWGVEHAVAPGETLNLEPVKLLRGSPGGYVYSATGYRKITQAWIDSVIQLRVEQNERNAKLVLEPA